MGARWYHLQALELLANLEGLCRHEGLQISVEDSISHISTKAAVPAGRSPGRALGAQPTAAQCHQEYSAVLRHRAEEGRSMGQLEPSTRCAGANGRLGGTATILDKLDCSMSQDQARTGRNCRGSEQVQMVPESRQLQLLDGLIT